MDDERAEKIQTVERTLGLMESEELIGLDNDLRELAGTAGWEALTRLLALHKDAISERTAKLLLSETTLAEGMDDLVRQESLRAFNAGQIRGALQVLSIVSKVNTTAASVRAALDARDEE